MILEANYADLEKPFLLMRSVLSETDYKTEKHAVTIEVTETEVFFMFYDPKNKVEMMYKLDSAKAILEGVSTCSMKALYDVLKTYKKSEDLILIEREDDCLRIDDGVFPEEILVLYDDGDMVVVEESESEYPLLSMDSKSLSASLTRASIILKKTDIPTVTMDTQAVFISKNTEDKVVFHSFSLHHSYEEYAGAKVENPFSLRFPRTIASFLGRVALGFSKNGQVIYLSQAYMDGQELLLIQNKEKTISITVKGEYVTANRLSNTFLHVTQNIEQAISKLLPLNMENMELPSKVPAHMNVLITEKGFVESQWGYQGKFIKDFMQKNAISENSQWFELFDEKLLIVQDDEEDCKKTIVLSYRNQVTA